MEIKNMTGYYGGSSRSKKNRHRSKRVRKPNAALEKDLRFQVGYYLY